MSKLSQISTNLSEEHNFGRKVGDVVRSMQELGFRAGKRVEQLAQLAQYRNVYKKEYFTA
jgi:hypothetical protein